MKFFLKYSAILAICITLIVSCKDNTVDPAEGNIQSSKDNALAEGEFSSIFSFVDSQGEVSFSSLTESSKNPGIAIDLKAKSELLPDCAQVNFDTATKTLTIDFGTENCKCKDGLWRRGKIVAVFNGKYPTVGANVTISLENFYVEDMKVFGTKTVTVLGLHKVNIKVANAGIVTPTKTIEWNCDRTIEKIWGQLTPKIAFDDEYRITGNASGVNREGVAFTVTIDTPLIKKVNCLLKDFVSGVLTIQNDKGDVLSVDYNANGDEACNKLAKVTVNGVTKIITLR
jgi:hypothetical protein